MSDAGHDAPSMDVPAVPDAGLDAAADDAPLDDAPPLDAELDAPLEPDAPFDATMVDADLDGGSPFSPFDVAFDASACDTVVTEHPPVASPHVAACSEVVYDSVPPTSGPHYGSWPAFGPYASPIPWGFLVHGLEHGAVVVAYNCPSGCSSEVSALLDYLDSIPADPLCSRDVGHRYIVVPDPTLPHRFAAAAWGWGLTSECFDLPALGQFVAEHYAEGPENFCADGVTGLRCDPDAGTSDAGP